MSVKMKYPRLSDQNVTDDCLRALLYIELVAVSQDAGNRTDVFEYEVRHDEEYRPDLLSYRAYSTETCRWVVSLIAGNDDEAEPMNISTVLRLPTKKFIRDRIRHYSQDGSRPSANNVTEITRA